MSAASAIAGQNVHRNAKPNQILYMNERLGGAVVISTTHGRTTADTGNRPSPYHHQALKQPANQTLQHTAALPHDMTQEIIPRCAFKYWPSLATFQQMHR